MKKRTFSIKAYARRAADTLERSRFRSDQAYSYAVNFLRNLDHAPERFFGTNEQARSFIFIIKNNLLFRQPRTNAEFLRRLRKPVSRSRKLLEQKGDLSLRKSDSLMQLLMFLEGRQHYSEIRRNPLVIDWMHNPLEPLILREQLVAHYELNVERLRNKEGGAIENKKRILKSVADAIAWKGVIALKEKRRGLSVKKLRKFYRELASVEYNKYLLEQSSVVGERKLNEYLRELEELAFGHLVAEYGLKAGELYSASAEQARKTFDHAIDSVSKDYTPFRKMWHRQIPVKEVKFHWVNLNALRHIRRQIKPQATDFRTGNYVGDESLATVYDWLHFKIKHPDKKKNSVLRKAIKSKRIVK